MPGLTRAETHRLIDHVIPQGVKVTPTKNGQLLRLPDGSSTVVHYSVSDHRGPQKLKATLKRAGVTWPVDKHDNTRKAKPYPRTIQAVEAALATLGNPTDKVRSVDIMHALADADPPVGRGAVRTYMLWAGWEPRGNTVAMTWHRKGALNPDIPEYPEAPTLTLVEAPAEEATPVDAIPDVPEWNDAADAALEAVPLEVAPDGREFIDSVASWTADLEALEDMTLREVRRVLGAAGLALEVRVWRG